MIFEHWNGTYKTYTVESSNIVLAIIDAKDEVRKRHKVEFSDSDILSIIRICLKKKTEVYFYTSVFPSNSFNFSSNSFIFSLRDVISSFCLEIFSFNKRISSEVTQ